MISVHAIVVDVPQLIETEWFCATRWVESEVVAERGMEIWPNIVKVISHWQSLAKSKRPGNKSYATLVENYQDKFVPLRFEFFRYLAKILQEYLTVFQTDRPMVPFLADALEKQLRKLIKIFITRDALNEAKTKLLLVNLNMTKKENLL